MLFARDAVSTRNACRRRVEDSIRVALMFPARLQWCPCIWALPWQGDSSTQTPRRIVGAKELSCYYGASIDDIARGAFSGWQETMNCYPWLSWLALR